VALLAVLGVCTYGFILKGSDTIFPNVYVAGVNVGGLKRDAAINAVKLAGEQGVLEQLTGISDEKLPIKIFMRPDWLDETADDQI